MINPDIQLTPHFNLKEFLHNGSIEGVDVTIIENLRALANRLEVVRAQLGGKPIIIDSGFRTWAHHCEIYKALGQCPPVHSQHLVGKAADIKVAGMTPAQVQEALKDWDGGLGSYSVFTHLDIWQKRRWDGP